MPNTPVPAAGGALSAAADPVFMTETPAAPRHLMAAEEQLRAAIAVRDRVAGRIAAIVPAAGML